MQFDVYEPGSFNTNILRRILRQADNPERTFDSNDIFWFLLIIPYVNAVGIFVLTFLSGPLWKNYQVDIYRWINMIMLIPISNLYSSLPILALVIDGLRICTDFVHNFIPNVTIQIIVSAIYPIIHIINSFSKVDWSGGDFWWLTFVYPVFGTFWALATYVYYISNGTITDLYVYLGDGTSATYSSYIILAIAIALRYLLWATSLNHAFATAENSYVDGLDASFNKYLPAIATVSFVMMVEPNVFALMSTAQVNGLI